LQRERITTDNELYDRQNLQESDDDVSISSGVVKDQRFQQLAESVLCGVNVRQRMHEAEWMKGDGGTRHRDTDETGESRDIEEVLDEEDSKFMRGYWLKMHVAQLGELLFLEAFMWNPLVRQPLKIF
jgi:hypothetical protein